MPRETSPVLAALAERLDEQAPPVTFDEVRAAALLTVITANDEQPTGPPPTSKRLRPAQLAYAAAIVLAAIGLVALLASRDRLDERYLDPIATPAPLADDLPPTGTWVSPEDRLVVRLAENVLVAECMMAAGFEDPSPTQIEMIMAAGEWGPDRVLGIRAEAAARVLGYQSSGQGGRGTLSQQARSRQLEAFEPERYSEYVRVIPECRRRSELELSQAGNRFMSYQALTGDRIGWDHDGQVAKDPRVTEALTEWRECLAQTVTTGAQTPNDLAREFAFVADSPEQSIGSATSREKLVAVADVRCQDEVDLVVRYETVHAELSRIALGADASAYDDRTRRLVETTRLANNVLADRNITPPSID